MISVAICDPTSCHKIETELSLISFARDINIHTYIYNTPIDLLNSCERHNYDTVFLNPCIQRYSGMQYAKAIRSKLTEAVIVFFADNYDYILDGYKVQAYRYYITCEIINTLADVLNDIMSYTLNFKQYEQFLIGDSHVHINVNKICYFESASKQTKIHLDSKESLLSPVRVEKYEMRMERHQFIKIHKCFLINPKQVTVRKERALHMNNGEILIIPKVRYEYIRNRLQDTLMSQFE